MQAEAGNEFVSRSRKQGKLPNQITLSTDLRLILLAYLRGTDPNPSEVNGKTPIAIRVPCTELGDAVKSHVENTGSRAETHCVLKAGAQRKRQIENRAHF